MSSISISILQKRRSEYQAKLDAARASIKSNEVEYDTLVEFKRKVERAQDVFNQVSHRETQFLAGIRPYYDHNNCVKAFTDVITRFLDSIGTKIVALAYGALVKMAAAHLRSIYNKIEDLNDDIVRYRDAIGDIEDEIEYQSAQEEKE